MNILAQVGYGLADKVTDALEEGIIDGAIFSLKDSSSDKLSTIINKIRMSNPEAQLLIDPQFFASLRAEAPNAKLGNLADWEFFKAYRKGQLEVNSSIDTVLKEYYQSIDGIELSGVITPNIYISQSLDSREAVIAKNFIRQAREIHDERNDKRPLYATLAISREALLDKHEFKDFLNDLTMVENPPDGFYIIIGSRSSGLKTDIYHSDVIANWLLLNMSLKVNGFDVINGYSDILSPLLAAVGADAGATGWWQNLRMFSMDKFFPAPGGGGRLPVVRYLSKTLLNRITFIEKGQLSPLLPDVMNGLSMDKEYLDDDGNDDHPERSREVFQVWEALKSLCEDLVVEDDIVSSLANCQSAVTKAEGAYLAVAKAGMLLDKKSSDDHLEAMKEGIKIFIEQAELG